MASGLAGPVGPKPVAGGAEVAECGWPTSVRMQGNCSGTLVHPQVVVYAAHCGAGSSQILVGETEAAAVAYATDGCWTNPAYGGSASSDFAVCRLAEPVPDVPIVPILMGCEQQILDVGVEVTSVGWGFAPDGPNGIKRAVTYPVAGVDLEGGMVAVGGGETGTLCAGDSGGGTYVLAHDGSWRVFGISSGVSGGVCDMGTAILYFMPLAVPWIEETTGFDVTPCTDAMGNWDPGPDCTAAPLDPAPGGGMWPACDFGPLSGPISSCGPPVEGQDLVAPTVTIVTPEDGTQLPLEMDGLATVEIEIDVDDGDGFGVAQAWLRIDGTDLMGSEDDFPPYDMPSLQFPEGVFVLEAVATDWAGNEGVSAPVMVIAGDPPLGDSTTGDPGGSSGDAGSEGGPADEGTTGTPGGSTGPAGSSSGGDTSAAADGGDGSGCGCRARGRSDHAVPLGLLVLLALRRRRR